MIPESMEQELLLMMEELSEAFGPLAFSSGITNLIPLATYVLVALSLYTIAKRRDIANPWLAWIPVAQLWILGSISDGYQRAANGKETKRRKWLIGLSILQAVMVIVLIVALVIAFVSLLAAGYDNYEDPALIFGAIGGLGGLVLVCLLIAGFSIALTVLQYMSLYDLYRSCDPSNAVLFLVLNILFSITQPILLMVVRNKDDGMPRVAAPIPERSEPWEN